MRIVVALLCCSGFCPVGCSWSVVAATCSSLFCPNSSLVFSSVRAASKAFRFFSGVLVLSDGVFFFSTYSYCSSPSSSRELSFRAGSRTHPTCVLAACSLNSNFSLLPDWVLATAVFGGLSFSFTLASSRREEKRAPTLHALELYRKSRAILVAEPAYSAVITYFRVKLFPLFPATIRRALLWRTTRWN